MGARTLSRLLDPPPADQRGRRFAQLICGLVLYGATASMLVLAGLGLDPWDVLHQGIAKHTPLSFGLAHVLVAVIVLFLAWRLGSRPGIWTIAKAVLIGAIPPFLLKTGDNPDGVDGSVFDEIKAAVVTDRPAYFKDFLDNFYNVDVLGGTRISDQAWQGSFITAVGASAFAAYACVDTWLTDFRADLPKIDVPTLLIHGDADRILPYAATAARLPGLIKDLTFVTVEGGPHNVAWTHPDVVNPALLDFLAR